MEGLDVHVNDEGQFEISGPAERIPEFLKKRVDQKSKGADVSSTDASEGAESAEPDDPDEDPEASQPDETGVFIAALFRQNIDR